MMVLKDNPVIVGDFDILVQLWDSVHLRQTMAEQKKKQKQKP